MIRFFNIMLLAVLLTAAVGLTMTSCRDELLYDDLIIEEGEAEISADLSFTPIGLGLDTRSSGTAIKNFGDVCVVVYTADGKFFTKFMANEKNADGSYKYGYNYDKDGNDKYPTDAPSNPPGNDENSGYDHNSESTTPKATFSFKTLPYGKYKIYAVANLGMLPDDVTESEENLKSYKVRWDEDDVGNNNSMFGFFTLADNPKSIGFTDVVTINKPVVKLHCWLKRLVSKVTVAFDPSGLKEAVTIYIRSVTIHDIPKECPLGEYNKPESSNALIADGETIYYEEGESNDTYTSWMKLQKGSGVHGAKKHEENDQALFFYENRQGDYQGQKDYLKVQIPEETGKLVNQPTYDEDGKMLNDFKDRVRYGSYIEVIGYYVSQNAEKISKGPIKYRFMLGQNTTYNYDADRNCHYKLTLKFRGWANEADWHIDYDEITPTVFLPDPYYISYLYNQNMTLPIRLTGYEQIKNYKLHAQIITNNWAPSTDSGALPDQIIGDNNDPNGYAWNKWSLDNLYKSANYAGFLSVRKTEETDIGNIMTYGTEANKYLEQYYLGNNEQNIPQYFSDYILSTIAADQPINGDSKFGTYDIVQDSKDTHPDSEKSVTIKIPMFTRAKQMVPATDFTGNNPFLTYRRKAIVRFSLRPADAPDPTKDAYDDSRDIEFYVKDEKGNKKLVKNIDITIYQVPRLVNPKGIWRRHDNTEDFHVELMELDGAGGSGFKTFKSDGPWRASILVDPDGLIKLSAGAQEVKTTEEYIEGLSGTTIDFYYTPNGTTNADKTRCGIILVEYHDYTCKHLIFVRQGYDCGVQLGNASWSCYNAVAAGTSSTSNQPQNISSTNVVVTNSPLSIGSMFKRCQYNYAILEKNNENYGWLQKIGSFDIAYVNGNGYNTKKNNWSDFGGYSWTKWDSNESRYDVAWADTWKAVNKSNKELTVPTYEQYVSLRDNSEYGYGVIYADGARGVQTNVDDAYGYTNYDNASGTAAESPKGIRACIVYNASNGNQILFPLGATGQGRRKISTLAISYNSAYNGAELAAIADPGIGSLTYSGMRSLLYSGALRETPVGNKRSNNYRPLTYNIYRQAGANYWMKKPADKGVPSDGRYETASWDINYNTLMFNPYDYGNLMKYGERKNGNTIVNLDAAYSSDALPIKFIYK